MSRARLIGTLLALILLVCVVVIFLDQRGFFGRGGGSVTPAAPGQTQPAPQPVPQPAPSGGGYGDL